MGYKDYVFPDDTALNKLNRMRKRDGLPRLGSPPGSEEAIEDNKIQDVMCDRCSHNMKIHNGIRVKPPGDHICTICGCDTFSASEPDRRAAVMATRARHE